MAIICITSGDYSTYPAVGLEAICSIQPITIPATSDTYDDGSGVYEAHAVAQQYGILFLLANGSSVTWKFSTSATRDTVIGNIAALALPVAAFESVIATT